jgi:cytosine/adenosine deaminase-related metal-dependent hydrolase
VHANGSGDDELRMLADAGGSVSISPDVELKMGLGWPETGRMLAAGGDMFATMRTADVVQRGLDGGLSSRDLLEFATVDGARACGLGTRTGSLTPGKDADVILLRADDLTVFPFNNPASTIAATAGIPLDGTWRPRAEEE